MNLCIFFYRAGEFRRFITDDAPHNQSQLIKAPFLDIFLLPPAYYYCFENTIWHPRILPRIFALAELFHRENSIGRWAPGGTGRKWNLGMLWMGRLFIDNCILSNVLVYCCRAEGCALLPCTVVAVVWNGRKKNGLLGGIKKVVV